MTQAEAAGLLGMALDNYIRIERGKRNLTLHSLVRLALMLNVSVGDLFVPPINATPRPGRPPKRSF